MWIAFKLYIFDRLETASMLAVEFELMLWIAFKLYIFDRLETAWKSRISKNLCCELLSNFISLTDWKQRIRKKSTESPVVNCFQTLYLWQTGNSKSHIERLFKSVVNCFQTLYLWQTGNSLGQYRCTTEKLWIAFKLYIFDRLETAKDEDTQSSCPLWIAFKLYIFDRLETACLRRKLH